MATVKAYVYVEVDGEVRLLHPGDSVPDGVTVTNPDVLEGDDAPKSAAKPKAAPAKS